MRGLRPAEFLTLPLLEQIFYYESMRREAEIENLKWENLYKMLGGRNY
ncbi:MAG: hypothetical protein IJT73_10780 [Selenomonadaceae bacterium]|nr:hypothetical protein [Selenomonadaceae bacterium]